MTLRDALADAITGSTQEDADDLVDDLALMVAEWPREHGPVNLADAEESDTGPEAHGFI